MNPHPSVNPIESGYSASPGLMEHLERLTRLRPGAYRHRHRADRKRRQRRGHDQPYRDL